MERSKEDDSEEGSICVHQNKYLNFEFENKNKEQKKKKKKKNYVIILRSIELHVRANRNVQPASIWKAILRDELEQSSREH